VVAVRKALDRAWESWGIPQAWQEEASAYCRDIRIVVSGGFTPEKITRFELLDTPVDIYGVGSSLMANDTSTNTDFTADVTAVYVGGEWVPMAKAGRQSCDNPDLELIPSNYVARQEAHSRT
jgi:nicotinate phosphoribosyltransferase